MKNVRLPLFAGLLAVGLAAAALDLTGKWEVESNFDDSRTPGGGFDCVFEQDGEKLTGSCSDGTAPVTGELKGQNVTWKLRARVSQEMITFTGEVDEAGTSMKGRFTMADKGGTFTASKQ
jgi:hypothetical protein